MNKNWKRSKWLRDVLSLCLCAAMLAGAFRGIELFEIRGDLVDYYAKHHASHTQDFTETSDFRTELSQFRELLALYVEAENIWPLAEDTDTVLAVDRYGNGLGTKEFYYRAGKRTEKYETYLSNYLKNQNTYYDKDIHILDLLQDMRALKNMMVIDGEQIYYSVVGDRSAVGKNKKEQEEKDKTLLKFLKGDGKKYVLQESDLTLPGFEQNQKSAKYNIKWGHEKITFEPQNYLQKILFEKFSDEERQCFARNICLRAVQNDFKNDVNGYDYSLYEETLLSLYRENCLLGTAGEFYQYQDENDVLKINIDDPETGEEESFFKNTVFYKENGQAVEASKVVHEDAGEKIYSDSMVHYIQQFTDENQDVLDKMKEVQLLDECGMIPVSREVAEEYMAFLGRCIRCLEKEWKDSPYLFYMAWLGSDADGKDASSVNELSFGNRLKEFKEELEKGQGVVQDEDMTRDEAEDLLAKHRDFVYFLYNNNGEFFQTNLTRDDLEDTEDLEIYLSMISDISKRKVSLTAIGIDMKMVMNPKGNSDISVLYRQYQTDREMAKELISRQEKTAISLLALMGVILLLFLLLACMTGHAKEGIVLLQGDKIWVEVILVVGGVMIASFVTVAYDTYGKLVYTTYALYRENVQKRVIAVMLTAIALVVVAMMLSLIRRVKAGQFWSTSILYKLSGGLGNMWKKTKGFFAQLLELPAWKRYLGVAAVNVLTVFTWYYVCIDSLYSDWFLEFLAGVLLLAAFCLDVYFVIKCLKNAVADERIRRGAEKIAAGDLSYKIEAPAGISKEQRELIDVINNIRAGLERAVDDSVRNERMKTELITNVSHDIKTPLTSVINYVDLMKREQIDNEKVQEYLDVLDQKSQRLKVLIEDLVEASKASSGALELQMTSLNFNELVNQTNGEFEEKFRQAGLVLISNVPDVPVVFRGDGRRVYRVLENLYGNVAKYALSGSRVYVDLSQKADDKNGKMYAVFTIKNISRDALNITSEELTERFVRGEQSRTTEGSGLGLSIAKSLTELMDGDFHICLDGDLFRVEVRFPARVAE